MATNDGGVLENTTFDRNSGDESGNIIEVAENTVNAASGAMAGATPQAGAADGAAVVVPAAPNGEVAVTIPAGQTVVRVQVAPGETIDLPFDGALAAKLGQGNLAIKSGDQTIILIGYSNANQEGGVTLHDHRGQNIDIAATIAQTDPNLDIQTAAGPAAGPAGAQGGHLFFGFSPEGGLGGIGELGVINATELNYRTIQPDETILVPPPATVLTPPTVIVENGSTINEDDLQGRYPQTDEVALLAMPPFGGYGPRQGNDAYDNTDLDTDGIFPEPVSTTIHVTANPGSSPSLALAFDAATIAALEARHLFSENLPLQYNISPDGKTLTAFVVTGEESTLEIFRADATDGVAQPDGTIKFDITVTLEHSLDNDGSQANVSDANPNFADDITLGIPFTVSGSGGSAGAEFGVTFRDDTPSMGPVGNLETVAFDAGINSVSEANEPASLYGSFQFSYGADGEATEGDTFQYGSLAGQKEGPNATFLLSVNDPEAGDSAAPLLTIDTRNVAAGSWTDLAATVSSLKSGQENVTIWAYRDGDVTIIEGRTSGDPSVDDSSSGLVFKITAYNHSGFYEADFYAPLGHPDANQTGGDDPLQFNLTATITDGDNDTFSGTQSFQLLDDGPTAVVSADNEIGVRIDETAGIDAGTNDAAGDGPFGLGTPLAWGHTAAPVVQITGSSYGADGAGSASLTLHPSSEGVFSGLYDVQTGFGIYLYQQGANVVGLVGTDASGTASGANPSGALAVAFQLEGDGTLDAAEYRALQHSTSTLGDTSEPVHVDTQALQVTLSITDADGDTATSSTGIGNHISFLDDGPTASDFNIGTFTEHTAQVDLGTVDAVFGGHYTSGVDGLDALQGIVLTGADDPSHGTLSISGGHVYYTPASNVVGDQTFTFGYQVTDGDGDTATGTISVAIKDNVPNIIQLTPGGVDLYEAGLPDGSGIGNTTTTGFGAFQVDTHGEGLGSLQIGVDAINLAGPFPQELTSLANAHVTILGITDVGGLYTVNYSYTLEDADASSGNNGQNLELTIINGVLAVDASGDPATSTVTAHIYDDVPTAQADSRNTNSGATINGNVEGNDTFGADGKDAAGGVVGVATGTNTAVPVSGGLGVALAGAFGTLTLNADGSYSYHANPNASGTDHFVYTVKDGDGDLSTTTLDITVNQVAPVSDTKTVTVDEAALDLTQTGLDLAPGTVTGSNPALTTETATGALSLGAGVTVIGGLSQTGLFGVLQVDAAGHFTYTLTKNDLTGPANDSTNTAINAETFTVTIRDADGNTATDTIHVSIVDDVPTAQADSRNTNSGATINGNVESNDTFGADGKDAAGGVVGIATGTNTAVPVSGGLGVALAGAFGTLTLNADGSYSYHANPNASGTDHFVYTVKDGDGDLSTTTLDITVNQVAPVSDTKTVTVDEAALDLTQTGLDLAPGTVTGSNPALTTETATGALSLGAGVTVIGGLSQTGLFGVLQVDAAGHFTYTLTKNDLTGPANDSTNTAVNAETFTVTIRDADGNTATDTIHVSIVDDVPTAQADSRNTNSGATINGNVEGNDTFGADGKDAAGGVVGVATGTNTAVPVSGGLGVALAGAFGTLTLNADGSYSYHANPNASGTDHFVYTVKDGDGDLSTTTLDITVNQVAPVSDTKTVTVDEAALDLTQTGLDLAPGTVTGSNPALTTETATGALSLGAGVTVIGGLSQTGLFGVLQVDAAGHFIYTLTKNDLTGPANDSTNTAVNAETFTVTIRDADGNTATDTIHVSIVDDVPTAQADSRNTNSGATINGNVESNDTFGADGKDAAGGVVGVATGTNTAVPVSGGLGVALAGAFGTLTLNADGSYSYHANPNASGTDHFVYTVKDGDGDLSTTTLDITVNQVAPVSDTKTVTVDEAALDLTQTGLDLAPGTVTGSNPALTTETATGALSLGAGVTVIGGLSQTGLFGVLQVDAAGHFTYTLTKNDLTGPANDSTNTAINAETFTVTIRDADGNTATDTIHVSIVDDVPTAQADSGGSLDTNTTVSKSAADGVLLNDLFGADGKDAGGGVVGVAFGANTGTIGTGLAGNVGTLTLNADGSYSYTSKNNVEGTDVFTYTIKDGDGDLSTTTLTFTVHDQAQGTLNNAAVTVAEDSEPNQNTGDLTITKGAIDLSGILTPADNEVVTSITITNIPTGVVISDGVQTVIGDGTNSITILAANFGAVTLQQPLDNKDNDYALSYSALISDPTSGNTNTLTGGLINVTVDAAADQPTGVSITVNDSADSGSSFSNGETGSLNVKATFGDYQDGSEVHTVTVQLESGFTAGLSSSGSLAGASYTYNAATGVIVFIVPNGTASLDATFAVTAPASGTLPGILNFTATATATETNFGGSEPVSGNNISSVTATTGIPATRILDGTITTNTASGSQEMILTFIDNTHPLDAFAQLFIRDAEGQQGAFLTDAGFNIDHSHDFGVTVENAIDGHSVLITDMSVEGVSVVSKGTVQLDHDDGSNKPVAITDIIHPGAGTDDGRINSTDDTSNHAGTLADPDGTHTNYLYGGALNDTVTATHTPTDTDHGDILNGGSGSNVLTGGSGNDVLVYNPLDRSEDGGAGFDILRVDQGALYNSESQGGYVVPGLTNATVDFGANNGAIHNIEAVLITEEAVPDASLGTTVKLSAQDVFNFSSDHELYVIGSAGDKVDLTYDAKGTWNDTGTTVTSSGGQAFEVWHGTSASGQVTLYIDHDLTTQTN